MASVTKLPTRSGSSLPVGAASPGLVGWPTGRGIPRGRAAGRAEGRAGGGGCCGLGPFFCLAIL